MIGTRPFSTLSPSLESTAGRTVTEPSTATRDDEHRADGHRGEDGVAGDQHAGHRDQHGHAGDEHGLAGGRGGELERGLVGAPGVALLHLAPEVEHRVVDADREADEQHDARGGVGHRDDLADRREQAERAHHGGEAEQQRHAGGDERAEGDDEDQQRDRQRERLGPLEVLLEGRVERLGGADASPNCSMRSSGCAFCAAAVAASEASTRSSDWSTSPGTLKVTSAERPSLEIWPSLPLANGDSTSWTSLGRLEPGDDVLDGGA